MITKKECLAAIEKKVTELGLPVVVQLDDWNYKQVCWYQVVGNAGGMVLLAEYNSGRPTDDWILLHDNAEEALEMLSKLVSLCAERAGKELSEMEASRDTWARQAANLGEKLDSLISPTHKGSLPDLVRRVFALDERIVAVKWDGQEPMIILPRFPGEEEMVQQEYVKDSETDLLFEELWDFFRDKKPTRYNRPTAQEEHTTGPKTMTDPHPTVAQVDNFLTTHFEWSGTQWDLGDGCIVRTQHFYRTGPDGVHRPRRRPKKEIIKLCQHVLEPRRSWESLLEEMRGLPTYRTKLCLSYHDLLAVAYMRGMVRWEHSGIIDRLYVGHRGDVMAISAGSRAHPLRRHNYAYRCREIDPQTLISIGSIMDAIDQVPRHLRR